MTLNTQNTHVVALSISESTDSAIARIIAGDPPQNFQKGTDERRKMSSQHEKSPNAKTMKGN